MLRRIPLGRILIALFFSACSANAEAPLPGCQNLAARPYRPIPLSGKILATYLPGGRRYSKLKPPAPPDFFEVGILDLSRPETKITRLTDDEVHDAEVRVSPDGKKMVWTRRPALDLFDGENAIMIANVDMSDVKVAAHAANTYMGIPSFFKPAGDKIMFSSQGENDASAKLVVLDLNTLAQTPFRTSFRKDISDPQMSRDGSRIVFKSTDPRDADAIHIFIMNSDGRGVRQLTRGDYADEDPAFSPDGRTIAFERMYGMSSHRGQNANDYYFKEGIVSLDLATGRERRLTAPDPCGKNELWLPTWSPDGEFIMFTRGLHLENGEFTHDLWVIRKDGSDLQPVPNSEGIMFFDWVR
jgi:Tol biopolymer transport system component